MKSLIEHILESTVVVAGWELVASAAELDCDYPHT
jgi:hypothetical protein